MITQNKVQVKFAVLAWDASEKTVWSKEQCDREIEERVKSLTADGRSYYVRSTGWVEEEQTDFSDTKIYSRTDTVFVADEEQALEGEWVWIPGIHSTQTLHTTLSGKVFQRFKEGSNIWKYVANNKSIGSIYWTTRQYDPTEKIKKQIESLLCFRWREEDLHVLSQYNIELGNEIPHDKAQQLYNNILRLCPRNSAHVDNIQSVLSQLEWKIEQGNFSKFG